MDVRLVCFWIDEMALGESDRNFVVGRKRKKTKEKTIPSQEALLLRRGRHDHHMTMLFSIYSSGQMKKL